MYLRILEDNEGKYLEMRLASGERSFVDWETGTKMKRPNQCKAIFTLVLSNRVDSPCFWCKKRGKYLTLVLTTENMCEPDIMTILNCTRMSPENERKFFFDWMLVLEMTKEFSLRFANELKI